MSEPATRVLLVDMPKLLRELFECAFRRHPDMRVVGVRPHVSHLANAARETSADYVIVGLVEGGLPDECDEVFRGHGRPCVLGVAPHDGHVDLYELQPARTPLGRVSPDEVVAAVRAAAAGER